MRERREERERKKERERDEYEGRRGRKHEPNHLPYYGRLYEQAPPFIDQREGRQVGNVAPGNDGKNDFRGHLGPDSPEVLNRRLSERNRNTGS